MALPGGQDTRDQILQDKLPGGTILSADIEEYNPSTAYPAELQERVILGGTGKYFGVRGVRTVSPIPGKPDYLLVKMKFK